MRDPVPTDVLAQALGATLEGDVRTAVGLAPAGAPEAGRIVVCSDEGALAATLAADGATALAAVVVDATTTVPAGAPPVLRHPDPRRALAHLTRRFDATPAPPPGVDAAAHVSPDAVLEGGVSVGPGAVIGAGAHVGAGARIGAHAVVAADCHVGPDAVLHPHAVLYPATRVGARTVLHAGAVLGADGFGYAAGPEGPEKIHHLGWVDVGDDVEIGAGTCIDRGTLGATRVGDASKIDNLCQIGHNVQIGRGCLVAGTCAIGGSCVLGDGVVLGGGVGIRDHVRIGDGAQVAARAGVSKDVPAGEAWGGTPAVPMRAWARERYLIGNLEAIWRFVRAARRSDDGA
ncbi:MAG: UDP-3-O-(3-hydroxymyristoyl)glucosamine N-acyltransferase [Trueperaceae bacterium]|nr:UDP-3-O-(3-hydroxymyristoyl)glucosamine N-acyltransferase [Trueperaceae bacterium]